MNETEARQLCTDRHRNPDRDMTGPDGPLKAWELYADTWDWDEAISRAKQMRTMAPYTTWIDDNGS